ncbi:hypothetical protein JR316_0011689 [Psilocybe cubensis]|uniref:Transmembrane protein n=2 Tax=Psilocybe cubensis TaxID=181762 RepID=A0A8H7XTM6_PSICU|nr:hypothetical protein JR316_0011689 [Psilocybe cubensis]KAH9476118.1 hypothetical protein JR316_0011689 [Psilocybe cubensis]
MFSRLSTLFVVACASLSIAMPVMDTVPGVAALNVVGGQTSNPANAISPLVGRQTEPDSFLGVASDLLGDRDSAQPTLPEIVISLTNEIKPICAKLEAAVAVAVKADINVDLIVSLLGDIVVLIEGAIVDIKVIVANPAGFVLSVAGTVITVNELAVLVAALLTLVLNVLFTVTVGVQGLAAGAVLIVVAKIGGLLAVVLGLAVQVVPNVCVLVAPQITAVVHIITSLKLDALVVVLGLPAKY